MPPPLLLSVKDAAIHYNDLTVFENLSFNIHEGSRIALAGRNGAGKSTLMNIITGQQELDGGERWEEAGVTVGYLHQDITPRADQTVFDYIFENIKAEEKELYLYKVDMVVEALELDKTAQMKILSGGQLRRVALARILVEEPDILLLDEPTNHLDLEIIEWLEGYLKSYRGTLLVVSHDRTFLSNVTNQVFWLDRGSLRVCPHGFKHFEAWSATLLEQEARELKNRKQSVMQEVEWASRGVQGRRKRNVLRVENMKVMRAKLKADESAYRRVMAGINLTQADATEVNSKVVAEFYNVYKAFEDGDRRINIFDKFSFRIQRGDRLGILGKNGSGKTTFLKMLMGELDPDQGRVKVRREMEFSYLDQKRDDLNPEDTLRKTLSPAGGDHIDVMGKQRHVCGYLRDFLFDPARVQDTVSQLSGGQKNRLMLAKILAHPKSCLILDEPTNDLDMDTVDMLERILSEYKGTLIVVSHDRDFLDQTVTKIVAFEGDGKIDIGIGGYSDYLERKNKAKAKTREKAKIVQKKAAAKVVVVEQKPAPLKKLTYKLEYELEQLPKKITEAEGEIAELSKKLADGGFYTKDPDGFHSATKSLGTAQSRLERYELRWLELDEMKAGVSS